MNNQFVTIKMCHKTSHTLKYFVIQFATHEMSHKRSVAYCCKFNCKYYLIGPMKCDKICNFFCFMSQILWHIFKSVAKSHDKFLCVANCIMRHVLKFLCCKNVSQITVFLVLAPVDAILSN